jgi:hypothetical protein
MVQDYENSVFLNCPFDLEYQEIFYSVIFAIQDCGFLARCALEINDSGMVRIEKIFQIIEGCKYGIHDISRTEISEIYQLPRFNMPLELGLFLGAKRWQNEPNGKLCLILDREPHRYQKFCSDIAGQDIQIHNQDPKGAIKVVRNWLSGAETEISLPGGGYIAKRYDKFCDDLPLYCERFKQTVEELTFKDFRAMVIEWLEDNKR